jgi:gamma-carbonic anhydrase
MKTVREHYLHPVGRGAVYVRHRHAEPRIHESAYVAPTAVLCGDVVVGPHSRILFGAVITAEGGPVEIGANCVVMEHAVVRGTPRHPTHIGDNTLIGPHAHLNGCAVEGDSRIATGSVIFTGARLQRGAEVEFGAVVHVNTVVPAGVAVPMGWFAGGDPAELIPPAEWERIRELMGALDYPGTVFGVGRDGEEGQPDIAQRYARGLTLHRYDEIVEVRQARTLPPTDDPGPRTPGGGERIIQLPE